MNIYLMKKPKKINSVSITLGIIGLIIAYVIWFLVPAFWPIFQLTGVMRGACNDAYRTIDDQEVMQKLLKDASRTGLRLSKENFRFTRVPYTQEELQKLTKGRRQAEQMYVARGKRCVLEMHYEQDYTWPLIGKTTHLTFDRTVEAELATVKWEKACTCVRASSGGT